MTQDQQKEEGPRSLSRRIVLAGMVVAAVMGAGLGVWARTAPSPVRAVEEPESPLLQPLQIVVEDTLPPIGQLLEVLPPELVAAAGEAGPLPTPLPTFAKTAASAAALPVVALRPAAPADSSGKARKLPDKPRAEPRLTKVKSKAAPPAETARAIKVAEAPKPKASKSQKIKVQKAKGRNPAAVKPPVKVAKSAPARKAPPARPPKRREEPGLRVARDPCALPDPGAALVCADQRLGARDRQLQRAYRRAEAAGVPPTALRRREARWLEVRAAAAREAPWAVEDVYVARISEINDMIRDVREN